MCKCVFHLYCLDPPLAQRPKTGYSWSCAPCSKAHEDEVEAYMETGISPVKKISDTVAVPGNSRAKGKGRASESKGSGDKGKAKEGELFSTDLTYLSHTLIHCYTSNLSILRRWTSHHKRMAYEIFWNAYRRSSCFR